MSRSHVGILFNKKKGPSERQQTNCSLRVSSYVFVSSNSETTTMKHSRLLIASNEATFVLLIVTTSVQGIVQVINQLNTSFSGSYVGW